MGKYVIKIEKKDKKFKDLRKAKMGKSNPFAKKEMKISSKDLFGI